jgi:hypothetical protein
LSARQDGPDGVDKKPAQKDKERTEKASQDNDLTTGHSDPEDGGADNAKQSP